MEYLSRNASAPLYCNTQSEKILPHGIILALRVAVERGRGVAGQIFLSLIHIFPIYLCWGPERTVLLRAGLAVLAPDLPYDMDDWAVRLNPGQELCGAMIRADAYGYACPGDPELAARLAFRDASFTHRKTGVYSAMFVAAAIAAAFTAENWKEIVVTALQYVPQRSRDVYKRQCLNYYEKISEEAAEEIRGMLVFDAVIYNEDRHFGNFGVLPVSYTHLDVYKRQV